MPKKYISYKNDKLELQKILDDKSSDEELKKMAETELDDLETEKRKNEKKLKLFLITKR
jgi:peptide chain release factor 1